MENNSITDKDHKYAVWLRRSPLWKEKKAISICPDLEKKNVVGKLCTYIRNFIRLASHGEPLEQKQKHFQSGGDAWRILEKEHKNVPLLNLCTSDITVSVCTG